MITGDVKETATCIAKDIGIIREDSLLDDKISNYLESKN